MRNRSLGANAHHGPPVAQESAICGRRCIACASGPLKSALEVIIQHRPAAYNAVQLPPIRLGRRRASRPRTLFPRPHVSRCHKLDVGEERRRQELQHRNLRWRRRRRVVPISTVASGDKFSTSAVRRKPLRRFPPRQRRSPSRGVPQVTAYTQPMGCRRRRKPESRQPRLGQNVGASRYIIFQQPPSLLACISTSTRT